VGSILGRLETDDDVVPVGLPVEPVPTPEVGPEHIRFRAVGE
jgi:hypothetical protein